MQQFIADYGYLAIFVLMLAESACVPVPSELTMLLGGALAAGAVPGARLNLAVVIVLGVAGNLAGSYLAWAVGRYGGPPAWRRWGRFLLLRDADLERAQRWFDRRGRPAVFVARLLPVVRTFISLPAGFARMPPARFGAYTLAGCVPWSLALGWAGYGLGADWQSVANAFHAPTYVIAAIAVITIGAALALTIRRRRHHDHDAESQQLTAGGPTAPGAAGAPALPRTADPTRQR